MAFAGKIMFMKQTFVAYEPSGQYSTAPQSPHKPSHSKMKVPSTNKNISTNSPAVLKLLTIVEALDAWLGGIYQTWMFIWLKSPLLDWSNKMVADWNKSNQGLLLNTPSNLHMETKFAFMF